MENLNFYWRFGNYGLVAQPKALVRFNNEPNETIDFVKYFQFNGKECCYSVGFFYYNDHEDCWELRFVGNRFCEISDEDMRIIFPMLKDAYDILTKWKQEG